MTGKGKRKKHKNNCTLKERRIYFTRKKNNVLINAENKGTLKLGVRLQNIFFKETEIKDLERNAFFTNCVLVRQSNGK